MYCVAPLKGAWIEMVFHTVHLQTQLVVAPHMGAWIEIPFLAVLHLNNHCRTPQGCVD